MAVDQTKVKARLKALFPKANLSTQRLDEITAKLAKKPEDNATDEQIDEVINDYNDLIDIESIAKQDDRLRTLEAKTKTPEKKEEEPKIEDNAVLEYLKKLESKIDGLEAEKTATSIKSQFLTKVKDVNLPDEVKEKFVPTSLEDLESSIEGFRESFKPLIEAGSLSVFDGKDKPESGDTTKKGEVKQMSAEEAKRIAESM